jgi:D-alanine-D-alanine ligase
MTPPRVLVLYNQPVLKPGHPDYESEAEVLYSVKIVRDSLTALGIPHDEFGVTDDLTPLLERLKRADFDVAFNLYEGTADFSISEVYFTGLLEWQRIRYTGCPSITLAVARQKVLAKTLFRDAGLPTAPFVVVPEGQPAPVPAFGFPAIVKPASEDASVGIEQAAVVRDEVELAARVAYIHEQYGQPALVEQYISGREIQVSMVDLHGTGEPVILPASEIAFGPPTTDRPWPIYTYTAKWDETSEEFANAAVKVGVNLPDEVDARLRDTVTRAYHLLGARDYARVDLRLTAAGELFILEMNPNPSITSIMIDSALPALEFTYDQFIGALVRNAAARTPGPTGVRRKRA